MKQKSFPLTKLLLVIASVAFLGVLVIPAFAQEQVVAENPGAGSIRLGQAIDFLDNCFFGTREGEDYYSREWLRERVKMAHDADIRKIYFRGQGGIAYYPSKVRRMYTGSHWTESANRLIKTINSYDVVAEYIKVCHEFGMELYYWDPIFDCTSMHNFPGTPDYERWGEWPSLDMNIKAEHYMAHRFVERPLEKLENNIGKLEIYTDNVPVYSDGDFTIYIADHEGLFVRYEGPFAVEVKPKEKHGAVVTISGLNITRPVIKLVGRKESNFSATCKTVEGGCAQAFYTDGTPVKLFTSCELTNSAPYGYGNVPEKVLKGGSYWYSMGWGKNGESLIVRLGDFQRYATGVPEFAFKENRERLKAIVQELYERYPDLDGVTFSLRNHGWPAGGSREAVGAQGLIYGFSRPIVDEYRRRYGKDITTEDFDLDKLLKLRGEYLTGLLAEVSEIVHGKGGKLECMAPVRDSLPFAHGTMYPWWDKMSIDDFFDIRTWAEKGYVDTVLMLGTGYRQKTLTPELQREIIAFREKLKGTSTRLSLHYIISGALTEPETCSFLTEVLKTPELDEVEFYEEQDMFARQTYPAFKEAVQKSRRPVSE